LAASMGAAPGANQSGSSASPPVHYYIQFIDVPHSHLNAPYLNSIILPQVHGAALVFDISDPKSIYAVDQWRKRLADYNVQLMRESVAQQERGAPSLPPQQLKHILLIAHKSEKKPHILSPRALSDYIRDSHYIKWYMTSLKWADSVEDAFEYLIVRVLRYWAKRSGGAPPGAAQMAQRMNIINAHRSRLIGRAGNKRGASLAITSDATLHQSASGTLDELISPTHQSSAHASSSLDSFNAEHVEQHYRRRSPLSTSIADNPAGSNAPRHNQENYDPFNHELSNFATDQVEELMEQAPYDDSTNASGTASGTRIDPDNVALKIQSIISFQDELSSFYRLLKRRLNEYNHLLQEQQTSFKKESFSKFCLNHEQVQLILSELKHEQEIAEDNIQNILRIYEQCPKEETMDKRCKKQFAELKRSFYMDAKERWSELWHSIRSFMFLHNDADALQQGVQRNSHSEVVPVLPESVDQQMRRMNEDHGIIQGSRGEADGILTATAPGIVQKNSTEMTSNEFNFKLPALDIFSYDSHYSSIHSLMEQGLAPVHEGEGT